MKILSILMLLLLSVPCYSETFDELITKCKEYDGKTVTIEGEVVGEVALRGKRKGFAWLNISDGNYGIGVFAPTSMVPVINHTGNYKTKGDTLSVVGILHRACPEHGGGLDIHAAQIRLTAKGHYIQHIVKPERIRLFFLITLIAVIIISLNHLKTIRGGKNEMD